MKDYQFAVTQWGFPGNGIYAARLAHEAGLDGLQLDFGTYAQGFALAQKQIQAAYLDDQQRYSIAYPSIVLNEVNYRYFIHGRDCPAGKISYDILEKAVLTAAAMRIPMIMVPLFLENLPHTPEEFENAAQALRFCCRLAQEHGIDITSESPMPYAQHLMLCEMVDMPNHSIFYDTQNYRYWGNADQMQTLEHLYPNIYQKQLHIKDGLGTHEAGGYLSGARLGKGDSDCFRQIQYLKEHGYRGWYIFEGFYNELPMRAKCEEDQLSLVRKDLATLKQQLGCE